MRTFVLCFFIIATASASFAQSSLYDTESEALYRRGLDLLEKSDYAAAREVFQKYIDEGDDDLKKTDAEYYAAYSALILFHKDGEKRIERFINEHPSHPKSSVAFFELGDFYFKQKKYPKAVEFLAKTDLNGLTNEQKATAQFELGYAYFAQRKFQEALPHFDALKRRKSKYQAAASYYAGYIHFDQEHYDEALEDLQRAAENSSYQGVVPGMIAAIYYKQARYDELIDYSSRVLSSGASVNEGEFYLLTADAYLNKNNFQQASENYARYMQNSKNPARPVRYRVGYSSYMTEDYEGAIDQFKRVAGKSDSIGAYASYYLGILYLRDDQKAYAKNAFDAARKNDYSSQLIEESTYQYAKVTYELGETMEAIETITAFQQEFPGSKHSDEMNDLLSKAYLNTKNYALAIDRLEAYQGQLPPNMQEIYQKAAFLQGAEYFNAEKYELSLQMFEKANRYPVNTKIRANTDFWAGESHAVMNDNSQAIRSYTRALQNCNDPEICLAAEYGLAYALYNLQQYDESRKHFQSYVNNGRGQYQGDALLRLADCYYVDKQYSQAIRYYNEATARAENDKDYAYLQLAVVNGIDGNIPEALRGYQQLLKEFPRSRYYDDAIYQRAQLNFENGSFEESIRGFSHLIREKPRSPFVPYAHLKRGTAYYNLQDYDRCISDYQTILNDYSTHPAAGEALLPLQEVLNLTNRSDEFAPYLATYKRANPDKENVEALEFETANNFYYNLEYQKSIDAFDDYIRSYPNNPKVPEARYLMAEAHYRLEQYAEAKTLYEGLLGAKQLSQYNRVITRLATIEASTGDIDDAIRRYNQLAAGANNKKELYNAWSGLMEGHYAKGRYDSSRYYAQQILERAQVNVAAENRAHLFIGKSEMGLGNTAQALEEFAATRDNARDQSGAEAQYLIGRIQYMEGNYDASIETLIAVNNDFGAYQDWVGESYLLLADNYVAKDDFFQAKATLNSIVENFPDEEIRKKAEEKLGVIKALEEEAEDEVIIESDSIDIID